uniref:Transcription factor domain-containing protein n=1 Tax=Bionectria ochroleuca TaxID=29856 RepID=A0A0B7KLN0_BIOOC
MANYIQRQRSRHSAANLIHSGARRQSAPTTFSTLPTVLPRPLELQLALRPTRRWVYNNAKRMDPPAKRRAAIACNYCRKRTSGGHNDEHTSIILDRLENLERIVANFGSSETATTAASQHHASPGAGWLQAYSPAVSNAGLSFAGVSPEAGRINVAAAVPSPSPQAALHPHIAIQPESSDSTSAAMTIPIAHSTTTGDLLRSESIRLLVGDYPPFALSRVEVKRNVPERLSLGEAGKHSRAGLPDVSRWQTRQLIEAYFNLVGTQHPVLDRSEFMLVYDKVVAEGILAITHSVCLVFVVLALGAIAQVSSFRDVSEDAPPGIDFFEPALRHLVNEWPMFFGADIVLPQAMYLASLYFGYLSRPLQTWRLEHMASTSTQQILLWTTPTPALTRLCWAVFILECDTLAEHHLPRSGVEQLVEDMPFPDCGTPADPHMLSWLANISSRKLLNRIHNALYDQCRKQTLPKESLEGSDPSFRISHELAHQLREWFTLLPESIKPPAILENMTIEQAVLKMRYHAAGDIIFRPFLLRAFHLSSLGQAIPQQTLSNASECLTHCQQYINTVAVRLRQPSASLEIFLHSIEAMLCIVYAVKAKYRMLK